MNVLKLSMKQLPSAYDQCLNADRVEMYVDTTDKDKLCAGMCFVHHLARNKVNVWYIVDLNVISTYDVINLTNGLPFSHVFLKFEELSDEIYELFDTWSTHKYCLSAFVPFDSIVKYNHRTFEAWRSLTKHADILYNSLKYKTILPEKRDMSPVCYKLFTAQN